VCSLSLDQDQGGGAVACDPQVSLSQATSTGNLSLFPELLYTRHVHVVGISFCIWCYVSLTGAVPEPTLKELVTVKMKSWYNLGLQLDIEDDDLQTIKNDNPQDQEGCKRDMFRTWLRICPQASYRKLVQALVEVGDVREADRLRKKHGESCH